IMKLGEKTRLEVDAIPTGAISLDIALGVGGIPRGRITEIFGQESSGKTTLALQVIAEAQKAGGQAAFIDAEHALNPTYAQKLGVNLNELLISQPDTGEQALEIAESLIRSNAIDVVVIDSVAALVPRAELEGEMGDSVMGLQARLMSQALRKLTGYISKSQTAAVFINQVREKIGVFFGNPETTPGGRALKFYSSVRLEVRRIENLKTSDGNLYGIRVRTKIVKNKVAPPFKEAEIDILFDSGVSHQASAIDAGLSTGVIEKKGNHYYFNEKVLGHGKDNAVKSLKDNPELFTQLIKKIRQVSGLEKKPVSETEKNK
ncbi:MAG TPA: recombinase RecA, partial [bacterium]|nr:recombinase RecA [bacterium]